MMKPRLRSPYSIPKWVSCPPPLRTLLRLPEDPNTSCASVGSQQRISTPIPANNHRGCLRHPECQAPMNGHAIRRPAAIVA
jgi:hypothetical protein